MYDRERGRTTADSPNCNRNCNCNQERGYAMRGAGLRRATYGFDFQRKTIRAAEPCRVLA